MDPRAASEAANAELLEFPVYGSYCGPGFGDGRGCAPAEDAVDAACCRHDACYSQLGGHDCRCEHRLMADLTAGIATEAAHGNGDAVAAGNLILATFAAKPCVCGHVPNPVGDDIPIWVPNQIACPRT